MKIDGKFEPYDAAKKVKRFYNFARNNHGGPSHHNTHIPSTLLFSIARLSILNSQNHTSLGSVDKFRKISTNIVQKNHQNSHKFGFHKHLIAQ